MSWVISEMGRAGRGRVLWCVELPGAEVAAGGAGSPGVGGCSQVRISGVMPSLC